MTTEIETREDYVKALKTHDWHYAYSEDQTVWRKGHDSEDRLIRARHKFDEDAQTWNAHAPACFHISHIEKGGTQ